MTRLPRLFLFWAAAPAVVLSVWLLRIAEAPRSVQALQVVVASIAATVVVLARTRRATHARDFQWLALALTLSLFIPLLVGSRGGPERWLVLGSARLYVAPVVLPVPLFLLGAPLRASAIYVASVAGAATALVLQPDAPHLSAFTLAMLVPLGVSSSHLLLRFALLAVLLCCAVVAWRIPDPLTPVRYVEGVFKLAAEVSPFALLAALISAALAVIAFVWVARVTRSSGAFAVAVYYAALFALAPLQATPFRCWALGLVRSWATFSSQALSRARAPNMRPSPNARSTSHVLRRSLGRAPF